MLDAIVCNGGNKDIWNQKSKPNRKNVKKEIEEREA